MIKASLCLLRHMSKASVSQREVNQLDHFPKFFYSFKDYVPSLVEKPQSSEGVHWKISVSQKNFGFKAEKDVKNCAYPPRSA